MRLRVGELIVGERIGSGASGTVWAATHAPTGAAVAIKVLAGPVTPAFLRAFRDEVRAVAELHHPGIVEVYDSGVWPSPGELCGAPYLVMERLDGTLASAGGTLPWERLRGVLLQLLDALAHAHARGVLHRDLKPANVLGRGSVLKLTDFGLAHAFGIHPAQDREEPLAAGTPGYMAPEQFEHRWRDYGPWTDLYALGCLAWELACGAPPFEVQGWLDGMTQHLSRPLPAFAPVQRVPAGFEAWLRVLLRKSPSARFRCAADAAAALLALEDAPALASDEQTPPPAVGWVPSWTPPLRTAPGRLSGAGLGLFGLRAVPFVGRAAERGALWKALGELRRDGARLVMLRGAAGVGKSFLARWLAERAQELGAAIAVRAACEPRRSPGASLETMLVRHLQVGGLDARQVARRIDEALSPSMPAAGRALLASVLAPGSSQTHSALLEAAHLWLEGQTRERPVILWLDDAQWDELALAFAEQILAADPPLPVLIVATLQDEALAERAIEAQRVERLTLHPRAAVIPLGALPKAQHRQLVDRLLDIDEELASALADRTEGNPLFAVELVRDWVERGILVAGERGFRLAEGAETSLPAALSQVWESRLDRLLQAAHPDDAAVLELGAVLGGEVEEGVWRDAAARLGLTLRPELREALLERSLAVSRGGDALAWVHGMLRECLCARGRRHGRWTALNRAAAEALSAGGMRGAERAAICWEAAGEGLAAADALGHAAAWRLHRGADPLPVLDQVEARFDRLGLPPSEPRRGSVAALRVFAAYGRGDYDEAEAIGSHLLADAHQNGWSDVVERVLVVMAAVARVRLDPDLALARLDRAIEGGGGAYAMSIQALTEMEHRDRHRLALERAERAAALASHPAYQSLTACALAMVAVASGALQRAEEAVARAEALNQGSWAGLSNLERARGFIALQRGDHAEARALILRSLVYARRSGGIDELLWSELDLAHLALVDGRPAETLERLRSCRDALARAPRLGAEARLLGACALGQAGRWREAERSLLQAAEALSGTPVVVRRLGHRAAELADRADAAGQDRLAEAARAFAAQQLSAFT